MYHPLYSAPFNPAITHRVPESYIRLLHASPGSPAVDVYANGAVIGRNLSYRNFTPYLSLQPGSYNISIFAAGQTINPLFNTNINIADRAIYTAAVIGRPGEISLLQVPDPKMEIPAGRAMVRFVHLSPNAPALDLILPIGGVLFPDISYTGISNYLPVNPGIHLLQLRTTGIGTVVLNAPNIRLLPNRFYTVYAIGFVGGSPGIQVLIPLDGNSYINV